MNTKTEASEAGLSAYFSSPDLIRANELQGAVDLYRALLTVKHGFGNGKTTLGSYSFTKAAIKRAGIEWSFVVQSCELLGLRLDNRAGYLGHCVTLPAGSAA